MAKKDKIKVKGGSATATSAAGAASKASKGGGKKGKASHWGGPSLESELEPLGLRVKQITADGNCFFRALGDQLSGDEGLHTKLRAQVVDYVRDNEDMFAPFVEDDEPFDKYVSRMRKDGTWAGNIELQAASLALRVNLAVYQAGQPRWTIRNFPDDDASAQLLHVSYHDGDHYNSVRMADDFAHGPPVPIAVRSAAAAGEAVAAAAKQPRAWSEKEEERVMSGTGCYDVALVRHVLGKCRGDVDQAVEHLIEFLAQGEEELAEGGEQGEKDVKREEQEQEAASVSASAGSKPSESAVAAADGAGSSTGAAAQEGAARTGEGSKSSSEAKASTSMADSNGAPAAAAAAAAAARRSESGSGTQEGASSEDEGPGGGTGSGTKEGQTAAAAAAAASSESAGAAARRKAKLKGVRVGGSGSGGRAPSRNKPCSCGSGKKYKNCCGVAVAAAERRRAAAGGETGSAAARSAPSDQDALPAQVAELYI